jgi:hypothetical protein
MGGVSAAAKASLGIIPMSEVKHAEVSSILIYGASGMGKTTEAAKFASKVAELQGKRALFLEAEGGVKVIKHIPLLDNGPIDDYAKIIRYIQFLQQDQDYAAVVIDTLNEVCKVLMAGVLAIPGSRKFAELPVLQDWGLMIERTRNLVRDLRKLTYKGKWVIFTCSEGVDKDENTGRIVGGPGLSGKQLGPEICYLMDEVYHMMAVSTPQGPKRALITQPDPMWFAKSRVPGAPSQIICERDAYDTLAFLRGQSTPQPGAKT